MKKGGWEKIVREALRDDEYGDPDSLNMLCEILKEMDDAKQILRDKGYFERTLLQIAQAVPNTR